VIALAQRRQAGVWASGLLLLVGVGPWLFLLGYTAWEVIVPLCSSGRELWPPPSAALLFVAFYGLPWLAVVAALSMVLHVLGNTVRAPLIVTAVAAFLTLVILILTGSIARDHAWSAMRAECERNSLS
jgi:hypothetical protein